jgi:hypothetical protein
MRGVSCHVETTARFRVRSRSPGWAQPAAESDDYVLLCSVPALRHGHGARRYRRTGLRRQTGTVARAAAGALPPGGAVGGALAVALAGTTDADALTGRVGRAATARWTRRRAWVGTRVRWRARIRAQIRRRTWARDRAPEHDHTMTHHPTPIHTRVRDHVHALVLVVHANETSPGGCAEPKHHQ